ncbi:MAG: hypothetical protein WCK77_23715 [Verrucomicrobiota bacterium]
MNPATNHAPKASEPSFQQKVLDDIFKYNIEDLENYDSPIGLSIHLASPPEHVRWTLPMGPGESLGDTDVGTYDDDIADDATADTNAHTTAEAVGTDEATDDATDKAESPDEATGESPDGTVDDRPFRIGGKLLSRDLCQLRDVAIAARRAYIMLCAASDVAGKFLLDDPRLDQLQITKRDLSNLDKLGLISRYKHQGTDVGYITGGVSHARYKCSKIAPDPEDLPSRLLSSGAGVALHRDRLALYDCLEDLDVCVFHILFNQADSHGRGPLSPATIHGLIGRTKLRDNTWVTLTLISETVARLHACGRILTYQIRGQSYYAALDAKQHAMKRIPGSKVPPPAGQGWEFSLDSPESLEWYIRREPVRKERKEKRKASKAAKASREAKTSSKAKPASEMAPDDVMDKQCAAEPHHDYKPGRTNPAVFIRHVVEGRGGRRWHGEKCFHRP